MWNNWCATEPYTAEEHFEPVRYPVMAPWGYTPDFGPLDFV